MIFAYPLCTELIKHIHLNALNHFRICAEIAAPRHLVAYFRACLSLEKAFIKKLRNSVTISIQISKY